MLKRKIQKTTRGLFNISLPKSLLEAVGIKHGDEMLIEYKNGSIILTPVVEGET